MLTLQEIFDKLNENKNSTSEFDESCLNVIRNGLKINPNFWNDFLRICNNLESLSNLLDVPKDQIANWPTIINKYLSIAKEQDSKFLKKRNTIVRTGN